MIRLSGTVKYGDGRTEDFEGGTDVFARWEEYALRHDYPTSQQNGDGSDDPRFPKFLWMEVCAYAALEPDEGFDVWRKQKPTVQRFDVEADGLPPTLQAPSPE